MGAKAKKKRKMVTPEQQAAKVARDIGVPERQIERGGLVIANVVDLSGEMGEGRNRIFKALLNRGGTALDRWLANDAAGLFGEPERRAIHYCQSLWIRAEGNLAAIDHSADIIDQPLGWAQQEAFVELKWLEARVPRAYWNVFENVCRFDLEAGTAGSDIASNKRSAVDAAKTCVAFVAALIAMWRGL